MFHWLLLVLNHPLKHTSGGSVWSLIFLHVEFKKGFVETRVCHINIDISILIQPFLLICHPQVHVPAHTLLCVSVLWVVNMTSHKAVFLSSSVCRRATTTVKENPWRPASPLTHSLSWLVGITELALHVVFGPPRLCYRQCVFLHRLRGRTSSHVEHWEWDEGGRVGREAPRCHQHSSV